MQNHCFHDYLPVHFSDIQHHTKYLVETGYWVSTVLLLSMRWHSPPPASVLEISPHLSEIHLDSLNEWMVENKPWTDCVNLNGLDMAGASLVLGLQNILPDPLCLFILWIFLPLWQAFFVTGLWSLWFWRSSWKLPCPKFVVPCMWSQFWFLVWQIRHLWQQQTPCPLRVLGVILDGIHSST